MSETNLANATRRSAELSVSVAAGVILVLVAAATWFGSALAQQTEKIPDFSLDSKSAWLMISDNLLPPESGPGPVALPLSGLAEHSVLSPGAPVKSQSMEVPAPGVVPTTESQRAALFLHANG